MTQATQLISARWVIPVEPAATILENHAVVLAGARIIAILPTTVARQQFANVRETRLDSHVLIPGLINLHTHSAMTLMRGLADDTPLMTWLENHIWPVETKYLSEAFVFDGTELACAEMIRSGTTCFADMYFYHDVAARAARKAGMRAAIGGAIVEFPTPYAADAETYIARCLAPRDEIASDGCLKLMLAPHAPYTVSDDTFRRILTIAQEADFPIAMHIHETRDEIVQGEQSHGMRPIARLEKLGLLGPGLISVHSVHLTPIEIDTYARAGVHVAHCPVSNLKLASGIAPIKALLDAGINVGVGTDGAASNNRLDMLAEARIASLLQKGVSGDAAALPAYQTLEMCTLNAAKALGWQDEIGSLKPGKAADITAIELSSIETQPVFNAESHLFHAAGREHVSHVWVNGELLLDNRTLTRMDTGELLAKASVWQARFTSP